MQGNLSRWPMLPLRHAVEIPPPGRVRHFHTQCPASRRLQELQPIQYRLVVLYIKKYHSVLADRMQTLFRKQERDDDATTEALRASIVWTFSPVPQSAADAHGLLA